MTPSRRKLADYQGRRGFRRTPEPRGGPEPELRPDSDPIFVIQQHAARSMHWDLRLEVDGVLASWAVPKGPSTDPSEKRLALRTEDHPLSYADFEGVIPDGEYGAGAVIVWDAGPYENQSCDDEGAEVGMAAALEQGRIEVWLEGRKLRGGYRLVHARIRGDEASWLLEKLDDEGADARRNPTSTQPESVISGRTVSEVRDAGADGAGDGAAR